MDGSSAHASPARAIGDCRCACGAVRFAIDAPALLRLYCHCGICRRLNAAAHADVVVVAAKALRMPPADALRTARHRPPPALDRSLCAACGRPAFGLLRAGPLPLLAFVPSANCLAADALPAPSLHLFYEQCVGSAEAHRDGLPRHRGYWRSQVGLARALLPRLARASAG